MAKKKAAPKVKIVKGDYPLVAVLAEDIYEDLEAWYPILRLREAGVGVVVVGPEADVTYKSKHGYALKSEASIKDMKAKIFDGVIIPGGYAPDKMRRNAAMVKFVRDIFNQGGLVASICHGPWMMCEADILRGRKFTCVGAIRTDCENAGGQFLDQEVVVDGNLVTSRTPPDLPAMMRECLKFLGL